MAVLDAMLNNIAADEVTTLDQLVEIQTKNAPSNVYLPYAHNIYDIDLSTRTIYGPSTLSIQRDHKSEVIYFKVDRYYDYMDLSNTVCIIEYIVPGDKKRVPYIYIVPYYDTHKFMKDNKMIFPWSVGGAATNKEGQLEYAIRFYRVDGQGNDAKLVYNLNTLPTSSKILQSIESDGEIMKVEYDNNIASQYESLISAFQESKTYWTVL